MAGQFVGPCRLAARHGTTSSNPISSSGESPANLTSRRRRQHAIDEFAKGLLALGDDALIERAESKPAVHRLDAEYGNIRCSGWRHKENFPTGRCSSRGA